MLSDTELKVHTDRLLDETYQWFKQAGVHRRPPCATADLGYLFSGTLVLNRTFAVHPDLIGHYDLGPVCVTLERSLRLGYNSQATFCGLRGEVQGDGVWFTLTIALSSTKTPCPCGGGYEVWKPFLRDSEDAKEKTT